MLFGESVWAVELHENNSVSSKHKINNNIMYIPIEILAQFAFDTQFTPRLLAPAQQTHRAEGVGFQKGLPGVDLGGRRG
jgi:hypothetical protein